MMRPLLLITACALLAGPTRAAERCPAIERRPGPPVYAILYGYPHGTPETSKVNAGRGLETLSMVDEDLGMMARFFEALGPQAMYVHGEPKPVLVDRVGAEALRPPTWRSLLSSVRSVVAAIDAGPSEGPRPVVYLYLAGHGARMSSGGPGVPRLVIFARPEPGATDLGYDGVIHSAAIAERILRPLAARAQVHVIADTCYSYHLLQTRGMKLVARIEKDYPDIDFVGPFAEAFPEVGAALATRTTTHEDALHGGYFSHAIRSLAIGPADADADGVITYGELRAALQRGVATNDDLRAPAIVAPRSDDSAPFIDWSTTSAAQVCLPSRLSGRRFLTEGPRLFAMFTAPAAPSALWLAPGRAYGIDTGAWFTKRQVFTAADGPIVFDAEGPAPPERSQPFPDYEPPQLVAWAEPMAPPRAWSLGFAAVGGASLSDASARSRFGRAAPHADLSMRLGWGAHRLLVEGGYAWWSFVDDRPRVKGAPVVGHRVGGRLGYGLRVLRGEADSEVAALYGRYRLVSPYQGPRRLDISEPSLRWTTRYRFGPRSAWSWRIDATTSVAYSGRWMWPAMQLGLGVDFAAL